VDLFKLLACSGVLEHLKRLLLLVKVVLAFKVLVLL
jgi:hypothetical protein